MSRALTAAAAICYAEAEQLLLVGLYKDSGLTLNSYAFKGTSVEQLSSADIGASPSWITAAGHHSTDVMSIFAVSETGGTVASLTLGCNGEVAETSRVSSQGDGPVFLSSDPQGEYLLCANYGAGTLSVLPVGWNDGIATLSEAIQTLDFGVSAHAHSAYFAPGCDEGPCPVVVPTLGLDEVQQLSYNNGILSKARAALQVPAEQGPRHVAFHPTLPIAVLANEGSANATVTIELLSNTDATGLSALATYSASGPYSAPDMYPSEIFFSPDGVFVLVSVRDATDQKRDGVAVFKVQDSGMSLGLVGYTSVGHYPRSMALREDGLLVVGNQKGHSLSFLKFDFSTGALTKSNSDLDIGESPAFVGIFDLADGCTATQTLV